jgi:hypothetical protein
VDNQQHNLSMYLDAARLPASQSYMGSIAVRYCGGFVMGVNAEGGNTYWVRVPCVLYSDQKGANRSVRDFWWVLAHEAVSPRPIPLT